MKIEVGIEVRNYKKLSVVIEAYQWFQVSKYNGETRDVDYYRRPELDGQKQCVHCEDIMHNHGWIDTLKGGLIVCPGDFIITEINGEKYPCRPDIFIKTYEVTTDMLEGLESSHLARKNKSYN